MEDLVWIESNSNKGMRHGKRETGRFFRHLDCIMLIAGDDEAADIKALGHGLGSSSMTAVYVSWNGATEHRTWTFFL
ncbi:hypothetical protein F5Y17DRAFT_454834 [Xylariaceae sp. FL0594]|nr:hypothetical protein F5Y17DRAFT_454834 [Xylariaceae sp. FL0594]